MAVLVFLAASAGAGIIGIDLLLASSLGLLDGCVVLVGACYLGDFFSLHLLFYFDMEQYTNRLFHDKVEQKVEREEVAKVTGTNKDETTARDPKRRVEKKIYPNDPCPCGSGKKYKNCCGRKQ